MGKNKSDLDEATIDVLKKVLALPPKPHEAMKVGRQGRGKDKDSAKDRASSSKPTRA